MELTNDKTTYSLPVIDDINSIWGFGEIVTTIGDWIFGLGGSDTNVSDSDLALLQDMQSQLNGMNDSLTEIMAGQDLTEAQLKALSNLVGQNAATLKVINGKLDALQAMIAIGFQQIQSALSQIQSQDIAIAHMLSGVMEALGILNEKIDVLQASLGYGISYNAIVSPTQKLRYTNSKLTELNNITGDSSDEDAVKNFLLLQDFAKEVSNPGADGIEATLDALYNTCVGNEFLTSNLIDSSFQLLLEKSDQAEEDLYRIVLSLLNIFVSGYGTLAICQMLANRPVVSADDSKGKVNDIINKLILALKENTHMATNDEELDLTDYEKIDSYGASVNVQASSDDKVIVGLSVDAETGIIGVRSAKPLKNYEMDENSIEETEGDVGGLGISKNVHLASKAKRNVNGVTELLQSFKLTGGPKDLSLEVSWIAYDPTTGDLGSVRTESTSFVNNGLGGEIPVYYGTLGEEINIYSGLTIDDGNQFKLTAYTLKTTYDSEVLKAIEDGDDFAKFGKA